MTKRDYKCVVRRRCTCRTGRRGRCRSRSARRRSRRTRFGKGEIALTDGDGTALAVMTVEEAFDYDKQEEARKVYRTEEEAHPGVAAVYAQDECCSAGRCRCSSGRRTRRSRSTGSTRHRRARPSRSAAGRRVVGFQTRNPVHRAHEYIQKAALEIVDGLLLHPLVGDTKADDIPADVRMECYEALLETTTRRDRVLLSVLPAAMRYAGPREAIFHALMRKNYGCSHFIVGRDHAGVGNYYGTYDAQHIFDEFDAAGAGHHAAVLREQLLLQRLRGMASSKTCPHGADDHVILSGTQVREMLAQGERAAARVQRARKSRAS